MPPWAYDLARVLGDIGIAVIIMMIRNANVDRRKLRDDVTNALSVIKELQAWKVEIEARLHRLENNGGRDSSFY